MITARFHSDAKITVGATTIFADTYLKAIIMESQKNDIFCIKTEYDGELCLLTDVQGVGEWKFTACMAVLGKEVCKINVNPEKIRLPSVSAITGYKNLHKYIFFHLVNALSTSRFNGGSFKLNTGFGVINGELDGLYNSPEELGDKPLFDSLYARVSASEVDWATYFYFGQLTANNTRGICIKILHPDQCHLFFIPIMLEEKENGDLFFYLDVTRTEFLSQEEGVVLEPTDKLEPVKKNPISALMYELRIGQQRDNVASLSKITRIILSKLKNQTQHLKSIIAGVKLRIAQFDSRQVDHSTHPSPKKIREDSSKKTSLAAKENTNSLSSLAFDSSLSSQARSVIDLALQYQELNGELKTKLGSSSGSVSVISPERVARLTIYELNKEAVRLRSKIAGAKLRIAQLDSRETVLPVSNQNVSSIDSYKEAEHRTKVDEVEKIETKQRAVRTSNSRDLIDSLRINDTVIIEYVDRNCRKTKRKILLLSSIKKNKNGLQYFDAYCSLRNEKRSFFVDSVLDISCLERDASVDLATLKSKRQSVLGTQSSAERDTSDMDSLLYELSMQEEREGWYDDMHNDSDW